MSHLEKWREDLERLNARLINLHARVAEVTATRDEAQQRIEALESEAATTEAGYESANEHLSGRSVSITEADYNTAASHLSDRGPPSTIAGYETDDTEIEGHRDDLAEHVGPKDTVPETATPKAESSSAPSQGPILSIETRQRLIASDYEMFKELHVRGSEKTSNQTGETSSSSNGKSPQGSILENQIAAKKKFEIELGRTNARNKFNYARAKKTIRPSMKFGVAIDHAMEFMRVDEAMKPLKPVESKSKLLNAMASFAMTRFGCIPKDPDLVSGDVHEIGRRFPEEELVSLMQVKEQIDGVEEIVVMPWRVNAQDEVEYKLLDSWPHVEDTSTAEGLIRGIRGRNRGRNRGMVENDYRLLMGRDREDSKMKGPEEGVPSEASGQ